MTGTVILCLAMGSMIWLDRTYAFQFMISRPLVIASLLGFIMNDLNLGLVIGACLELLWLNAPPVGAYLPYDGSFCAAVAVPVGAAAAMHMDVLPAAGLSLVLCLPASLAGQRLDLHLRRLNERLDPRKAGRAVRYALARAFVYAFVAMCLYAIPACLVAGTLGTILPFSMVRVFSVLPFICTVIGLAALFSSETKMLPQTIIFGAGMACVPLLTWIF